ncbi:NAD binding oxidoreductase [Ascodesmis nigricans]|uniref:D-xylose 1-dehydrogenase (NADP(+), D-xylono-1,5-lactone-forming) n=1 Tax=Ascodesmis nigricans TaxID=341454 RepID=A0A4S2MSI7_9PEZI|nr:NAD binding oxidoreductase [Ascodesmis nigricans]
MAMALQISSFIHQYFFSTTNPAPKKSDPVRFGILSTALINSAALIYPVQAHPESAVTAIASRELNTAEKYAKSYKIPKAYGGYQKLLDDPEIDAIYISLPNGMHYEWAKKALQAGKHVLLEKPFTANADEARDLVRVAETSGKHLLEAFHWRFHPAARYVESILSTGKYGKILSTRASMTTPTGTIPRGKNIRWSYDLAGGALMDMTYVLSSTRYFTHAQTPDYVVSAHSKNYPHDERVDSGMIAELRFTTPRGSDIKSEIRADMENPYLFHLIPKLWELPDIRIKCEKGEIYFYNFMMPHLYHYITIKDKHTGKTETVKRYVPEDGKPGESWWSTYHYQLQAFVDKVKGREPEHWIDGNDSIAQMECIDAVYEKCGLGRRKGTHEIIASQNTV